MFIYIIKNKITNKRYVGKTTIGVEHRWKKHIIEAFNKKLIGYNFIFHRSIRKYGIENFEFEQIFSDENSEQKLTELELNEYEKYYINLYRTFIGFDDCCGYNMTLGGEGWSGRGNKQVDVYDKDLNYIITYYSIEETSRQLNIQATNISAVINGRTKSAGNYIFCENGYEPIPFKEEQKVKIDMYNLNREFIKTFDSMKDAAFFIGVNSTDIFNCCNQKQTKIKNYICLYHGDNILNHRRSKISKQIDVYNSKDKSFIKTFNSIVDTMNELKIGKAIIQRCLRSDNHLAGDYLIFLHGKNLLNEDIV